MEKLSDITTSNVNKLSRFFKTDMMYVLKSGFWLNANFVVTTIFGLITSIIFANFVSKNDYGTYQFILSIASVIAVIVPNNISSAVVRSVAQGNEGDFVKATRFQLRWGIIATAVSSLISLWYAIHNNFDLSFALIVIALFMPASFALNTWSSYLQGKKDYRRFFFYSSFGTIISYGGIIAMLFIKRNFFWIALANIFFAFLSNLILYFYTIKKLRPGNKTSPETINYGKHLSIMGIPQGLSGQLDALLIFHYLGASPLAVYSFATLLPEKLSGGLKFISTIIFPKFAEKNEEDVRGFFKKKIWWLLLFLAIVSIAYAIIAPYIFELLFPKYLASVIYTQVYAFSFFGIAGGVVNTALLSQKKTKELYITNLSTPFLKALLLIVLMFYFGIWGIIWAQIITIAFQIIFPIFLFNRNVSSTLTK